MFDRAHLEELFDLQRRSYALLRWVSSKAQSGTLPLTDLHGALDAPRAAAEWLSRNASSLPPDARPPEGRVEAFAHVFASYLITSFQVSSRRRVRAACGCELCAYFVDAPGLQVRAPSNQDRDIAQQLKLDCLEALAAEAEVPLFREELESLVASEPALQWPLALVAYARELDRRASYRGQGRPVLALWREIAWKGTRPDPRFVLSAEAVLQAEELIRQRLRSRAA